MPGHGHGGAGPWLRQQETETQQGLGAEAVY